MKKLFSALSMALCAFALFAVVNTVTADEVERQACPDGVSVRIHVAYFAEIAEDHSIVFYSWGTDAADKFKRLAGEDSFGAYVDFCVAPGAQGTFGVIALDYDHTVEGNDPLVGSEILEKTNWDTSVKITGDIKPALEGYVAGDLVDLYTYQAESGAEQTGIAVDPSKKTALITYFDSTGNYEEGLGLHLWDDWNDVSSTNWDAPDTTVFKPYSVTIDNVPLYVAALELELDKAGGFIIHLGDNKKTGDCKILADDPAGVYEFAILNGQLEPFENTKAMLLQVKDFNFVAHSMSGGLHAGTYGAAPTVIMYQFTIPLGTYGDEAPDGKLATDYAIAPLKVFLVVNDVETELTIAAITTDGKSGAITLADASKLTADSANKYKLVYEFDGKEAVLEELYFDREAPEIATLTGGSGASITVSVKLGASRAEVIAKFPALIVLDDVDGEITTKLYVDGTDKAKCTVDTRKAGQYNVVLYVQDEFGNIGTFTVIYNVTR